MKGEAIIYAGTSYYFDGERFCDPKLVCLSDNLDDVILYLAKVRGYIVINTTNPSDEDMASLYMSMGDAPFLVVADIAKYRFEDKEYARLYMEDESRANYMLVPHAGEVDRSLGRLSKKEAKTVMVPAVIERIIDAEYFHFRGEMEVALYSLKRLLYYVGREKGELDKMGPTLFRVCTFIEKILKGKEEQIDENLSSRHPVLFCSEPEYRKTIKMQEELEEMESTYRQRVYYEDRPQMYDVLESGEF